MLIDILKIIHLILLAIIFIIILSTIIQNIIAEGNQYINKQKQEKNINNRNNKR